VIENIGQRIQDVMGSFGYVGLALLLVLENLFPPIPSEVVLVVVAILFPLIRHCLDCKREG
jgi:membrane protein DedA with SNARE-associated domain